MLILIIIAVFGITFAFVFYNETLNFFTKLVDRVRIFISENKTLIDIAFLALYALLQLIFILAITKRKANTNLIIPLFVLSLLTLIGIERLCLKSRYSFLYEQMSNLSHLYLITEGECRRLLKREEELTERYENLKTKDDKIKKRK